MSFILIFLLTFLVSMVPIIELKGAIPMGVIWASQAGFAEVSPWIFFAAAFVGSCLPTFLILPLLKPVLQWLGKTKLFAKLSAKLDAHFVKKSAKMEEKMLKREEAQRVKAEASGKVFTEEEFAKSEKRRLFWKEFSKYFSIFLFVAVPLPGTGCWTGSAIAVFLGCKKRYAAPCIVLGNLVAGIIIMLLTYVVGLAIPGITIDLGNALQFA